MRHVTLAALLLLAGVTLCALLPTRAYAGEESPRQGKPREDSAAARLFREGWWQETGAGALEKAATSYRQAVAAEGSPAVRARAQYRLALVLERMGRVEQAVRALEALAEQFSNQTALLAEARAKLEAWSGEDLREHFTDWYRRYQYSPAFQSKIVDLVLRLGAPDGTTSEAASAELLTIGAPALPALRAHATSASPKLRKAVVGIMLLLDEVPPPEAIFATTPLRGYGHLWELLPELSEAARAALAAAAKERPDDMRARAALAVLGGPGSMIDLIAQNTDKNENLVGELWAVLMASDPSPEDLERFWALPQDKSVAGFVRGRLARYLSYAQDRGRADVDLLGWATSDEPSVRSVLWARMSHAGIQDEDAWRKAARWLKDASGGPTDEHQEVLSALLGQLRLAAQDADVGLAVDGLARAINVGVPMAREPRALLSKSLTGFGGSARTPRRVLARAIGRAKGQHVGALPDRWWKTTGKSPDGMAVVLGWMESAVDARVREGALRVAAREIRTDMARLMGPFRDVRRRQELHQALFQSLSANTALAGLDWNRESLTRLVEVAAQGVRQQAPRWTNVQVGAAMVRVLSRLSTWASGVFYRLLQVDTLRDEFLTAAAAAPERFTPDIWLLLGEAWSEVPENRALALSFLERGWRQWSAQQREAGLDVFLARKLVGRGDAALNTFLRTVLADSKSSLAVRRRALRALSDLKVADVTGAFDLGQQEEAEMAAAFLPQLPREEETYDAFKQVLSGQTTSTQSVARMQAHFRHGPVTRLADLVERLLAAPEGYQAGYHAVGILKRWGRAKDLPLWHLALKHPDNSIRRAAATALGNLYDDASIRALALVVDDPDPGVRDAALKSLERIETIEKQKAHWRKFAEGK